MSIINEIEFTLGLPCLRMIDIFMNYETGT